MGLRQGLGRKAHFVGTKIKSLRKRNHLTLEDLSVRCIQLDAEAGPSVSYLSMIENGKRTPSERLLNIIADIFQKDLTWFYDESLDDEAMDPAVRKNQKCANGYPNMPYGSNSYDHRYKGMATRIEKHFGEIDQAIALDIVKAVAMRNINLHSVLCNATDRVMWVAHASGTEDAWKQPYIRYDLRELFRPPDKRDAN